MTVRTLVVATTLCGGLLLSGCVTPASGGGTPGLTPGGRWALRTESGVDQIALAVHDDAGLSQAQRQALADLVRRRQASGTGAITVLAPSGDDAAAGRQAYAVKAFVEAIDGPVRVAAYPAPDPRAPVLAGFETVRAAVPDCSRTFSNFTATRDNGTASNFGCAINANLAAQIADPRDIDRPRDQQPADAGRRSVVLDLYRRGQLTSAVNPGVETARISQAVQ